MPTLFSSAPLTMTWTATALWNENFSSVFYFMLVWIGFGTKTTWLGQGKEHVLIFLKKYVSIAKNTVGDVLTSCQKQHILASQTQLKIAFLMISICKFFTYKC